jgi:integrase
LLLEPLAESPGVGEGNPFIFYSEKPDQPCSGELFRRNFLRAIKETANRPRGWGQQSPRQSQWSGPEQIDGMKSTNDERQEVRNHYFEYLYLRSEIKPDIPTGIVIGERKIDFHSFRHIYASRMADRMSADKMAKVTGHRSKATAKTYRDHVTKRILTETTS